MSKEEQVWKKVMKKQTKELVGYKKYSNGVVVPVYNTDNDWIELRAKLVEKVDKIEKEIKDGTHE